MGINSCIHGHHIIYEDITIHLLAVQQGSPQCSRSILCYCKEKSHRQTFTAKNSKVTGVRRHSAERKPGYSFFVVALIVYP